MSNPLLERRDYDGKNQLDKNREEMLHESVKKSVKNIIEENILFKTAKNNVDQAWEQEFYPRLVSHVEPMIFKFYDEFRKYVKSLKKELSPDSSIVVRYGLTDEQFKEIYKLIDIYEKNIFNMLEKNVRTKV